MAVSDISLVFIFVITSLTWQHTELVCDYFQHMRLLLVEGLVLGDLTVGTLRSITAKKLYESYTSSLPPPKVMYKFDVEWPLVWLRLNSPSLDDLGREFFLLL